MKKYKKRPITSSSESYETSSEESENVPKIKYIPKPVIHKKSPVIKPDYKKETKSAPNNVVKLDKLLKIKTKRKSSSSSDEVAVHKPIQNVNKKLQNESTSNFVKMSKLNNIDMNLERNYDLIPSQVLENLQQLKSNYSILFIPYTPIVFRVYELSFQTGGLAASKYKSGKIQEFVEETRSFLIKLMDDENVEGLYESYGLEDHPDVICVALKDFIELWVFKSLSTIPVEVPKNQIVSKELNSEPIKIQEKKAELADSIVEKNITQKDEVKLFNPAYEPMNEDKIEKLNKPKPVNIFLRSIMPQIKKQVEFYFSDKNYYKDSFLLEQAAQNEGNCKYT